MDEISIIKEQICDVCHKMWQLGWVAANDRNVKRAVELMTFTVMVVRQKTSPKHAIII